MKKFYQNLPSRALPKSLSTVRVSSASTARVGLAQDPTCPLLPPPPRCLGSPIRPRPNPPGRLGDRRIRGADRRTRIGLRDRRPTAWRQRSRRQRVRYSSQLSFRFGGGNLE